MMIIICKWVCVTYYLSFIHIAYAHGTKSWMDDVSLDELRAVSTGNNTVQGDPAIIGQYPFSVIFYENEPRRTKFGTFLSPICTGSIVSSRWVLTTATPLGEYEVNAHFMVAGVRKIVVDVQSVLNYTRNIYRTSLMIIHPSWHEYGYNNLGMVRTSRPFLFGKELGSLKMPYQFDVPNDNNTICSMNIWAAAGKMQLLMGSYQNLALSKQTINFRVANGPKFCSNFVFTNKTLCLIQVDSSKRKDVCSVNAGAIVRCNCQSVGLFTGVDGTLSCVDMPPDRYTAVNLVEYGDWLSMIRKTLLVDKYKIHTISSCCCINLNLFLLLILYIKFVTSCKSITISLIVE